MGKDLQLLSICYILHTVLIDKHDVFLILRITLGGKYNYLHSIGKETEAQRFNYLPQIFYFVRWWCCSLNLA